MNNEPSGKRTLAETAAIVFVAWIISIGAHEITHVIHFGYLGLDIQSVCIFGVGTIEKGGTLHVMNGWVIPSFDTQREFEFWEANREVSEYYAYFIQGGVLISSIIIMTEIRRRRIEEKAEQSFFNVRRL